MDVYNRTVEFGGAFASDKVQISFSGLSAGLLAQAVNATYAQNVNRIWELGSVKTYFIGGRTSGNFSISALYGPAGSTMAFLKKFGDLCSMQSNTLQFNYAGGWCQGGGSGVNYALNQVLVQQVQTSVQASDVMLNEQLSGMFNFMNG